MALTTSNQPGRSLVHVEVARASKLPEGVPADAPERSPSDRGERGQFAPGNAQASRGGKSRAGKTRLASRLGLATVTADSTFAPYKASAEAFKRAQVTRLAQTVGGGECGPAPSSIIASAALQLAASRWAFDRGQHELGSKLANDSRQNLLAAHELAAREAKARPASAEPPFWLQGAAPDDAEPIREGDAPQGQPEPEVAP